MGGSVSRPTCELFEPFLIKNSFGVCQQQVPPYPLIVPHISDSIPVVKIFLLLMKRIYVMNAGGSSLCILSRVRADLSGPRGSCGWRLASSHGCC